MPSQSDSLCVAVLVTCAARWARAVGERLPRVIVTVLHMSACCILATPSKVGRGDSHILFRAHEHREVTGLPGSPSS